MSKEIIQNRGFTLVEIMTAVFVFSIVVAIAAGLFLSAIQAQRRALARQELLDQTSYVMEYMSKAIRMAKKDIDGSCTIEPKLNYKKTDSRIIFENYKGECQEFFLDLTEQRLKESKAGSENYLTSGNLQVIAFKIGPDESWDQDDTDQPRVTFFLEIEGREQSKIKIQTTLSQRNLDIQI